MGILLLIHFRRSDDDLTRVCVLFGSFLEEHSRARLPFPIVLWFARIFEELPRRSCCGSAGSEQQ